MMQSVAVYSPISPTGLPLGSLGAHPALFLCLGPPDPSKIRGIRHVVNNTFKNDHDTGVQGWDPSQDHFRKATCLSRLWPYDQLVKTKSKENHHESI